MTLSATIQKKKPINGLPDGTYPAVLYRIIEEGKQICRWKERIYHSPKVLLSFVIPSQMISIKDQIRAVQVHKEYTLSLESSSHLYKDVIAMLNRDFDDSEDGLSFDLLRLLGVPVLLTTRTKKASNGVDEYIEIDSIQPLPETEHIPESPLDYTFLVFSNFNWPLFNSLSTRLQKKIESSPEFNAFSKETIVTGRKQTSPINPEDFILLA